MLLVPNMDTNLRNICGCSLLCFEEPTQNTASGPDSLRIASSLSPISLIAVSQEMRRYLPSMSFIGYLRRCECSVMPCSRMLAPLAQCAPRLIGESNTGSWRTHTPSATTASIEQPTEQCVHTVRLISVLPVVLAWASPMMPRGSWLANAAAPAVIPVPFRNARRSTVFAASAESAPKSGLTAWARACDLRVSSMVGSSDLGGLVVFLDVRGAPIARRLVDGGKLFRGFLRPGTRARDGSGSTQSRGEQEVAAGVVPRGLCLAPPPRAAPPSRPTASP